MIHDVCDVSESNLLSADQLFTDPFLQTVDARSLSENPLLRPMLAVNTDGAVELHSL